MNDFDLNGQAVERARRIYTEVEAVDALFSAPCQRRPSASALYAAARGGPAVDLRFLLATPAARSFYRRAVAETALFSLPEARAASTGAVPARRGEACHVRVERSRAEPDQFYVVVELANKAATSHPTSLIICDRQDYCQWFPLPAVRDGVAQIIADADSELMRLIGDPASKVYLR